MQEEKNALQFVLDFEAKGAATYLKLAAKTADPLGKKLFYSLAAEEVAHAGKADVFYSGAAVKTGGSPVQSAGIEAELKGFFDKMGKTSLGKGKENTEGYELAMELEKKGYEAYNGFLKSAKTEEEKAFFKWILGEEKEHFSAIANVYSYLTGTGDWLEDDESRRWNWMNL